MKDKYTATWISHTSINDYLQCPRAYYLKNMYKDRASGNKIQIVSPALSLGSAVHEVLESLSYLPTTTRFSESLVLSFDKVWEKYTGKNGGFVSPEQEFEYKERGKVMLRKVMDNPGPIGNLSIRLKNDLLYFWLSEEENIILCGKIDWFEYKKESDSVHIVDFKTSKKEEKKESLQLPIYLLLAKNSQSRKVDELSYWYLELDESPTPMKLVDLKKPTEKLLEIGRKIKLARKLNTLSCKNGQAGCYSCTPFEQILLGKGEKVGSGEGRDLYFLPKQMVVEEEIFEEDLIH